MSSTNLSHYGYLILLITALKVETPSPWPMIRPTSSHLGNITRQFSALALRRRPGEFQYRGYSIGCSTKSRNENISPFQYVGAFNNAVDWVASTPSNMEKCRFLSSTTNGNNLEKDLTAKDGGANSLAVRDFVLNYAMTICALSPTYNLCDELTQ